MTIYMVPNLTKENAAQVARQAGQLLQADGVEVIVDEMCASLAKTPVRMLPVQKALEACDIILCIGGDGSILHMARRAMDSQKPLLGVNVGRLGFLTAVEANELEKLHRLPKGDYFVENRSVLQADPGAEGEQHCVALNDIVFFKETPEKSISLDIYCDDILVSRFRGDGVVFATPTGSTAYSMSAGGPILDARLGGIIVTQICAHIVQTPPLVFAADRLLKVVPTGTVEERVYISCDGKRCATIEKDQPAFIRQSESSVPLVQFSDAEQLQSIDKKLKGR